MAEHRIRKVTLNNIQVGEKNYLLGERVRIPAVAHLARGHREIDLAVCLCPAEDAHLVDADRGRKGGGDPRLALIARQDRRAPNALTVDWLGHT